MIIRSKRQEGDRVEARRDPLSARSSFRQCAVTVCCMVLALSSGTLAERRQFAACVGSIADSIAGPGRKNVAVVDFTDLQGNATELGRTWAEEISLALASLGRGFKVVDRTHLKAILQEHRLSATGLMDDQTVKRLGQFVGVDALVTGSITPLGDSMRLLAKVLDTKTAQLIAPCTVELPRTEAVDRLHARLISDESPAVDVVHPKKETDPTRSEGTAGTVKPVPGGVAARAGASAFGGADAEKLVEELAGPSRDKAREALRQMGRRAVPALVAALEEITSWVRQEAASLLGDIGDPSAVPALVKLVKADGAPMVRWAAAAALGSIGHEDAVKPLMSVLGSEPDDSTRRAAARALGKLGAPAATSALVEALQSDKSSSVRLESVQSLREIATAPTRDLRLAATAKEASSQAVAALIAALAADKSAPVRQNSVWALRDIALGNVRDPRIAPALKQALNDVAKEVRDAAEEVLKRMRL